ncbi:hypothetical protein SNEBB_007044 [Seison nebaliae]|nr:hypothetical protein SNEBB_007044 [Seison nebaliae]
MSLFRLSNLRSLNRFSFFSFQRQDRSYHLSSVRRNELMEESKEKKIFKSSVSLTDIYQTISDWHQKKGRIPIHCVKNLREDSHDITELTHFELMNLLRSTGHEMSTISNEERLILLNDLWKRIVDSKIPLTINYINSYLNSRMKLNDTEMELNGILKMIQEMETEPNKVTYQLLLENCGKSANIGDAQKILQLMKTSNFAINEKTFAALLVAHIRSNNLSASKDILNILRDRNIELSDETRLEMVMAHSNVLKNSEKFSLNSNEMDEHSDNLVKLWKEFASNKLVDIAPIQKNIESLKDIEMTQFLPLRYGIDLLRDGNVMVSNESGETVKSIKIVYDDLMEKMKETIGLLNLGLMSRRERSMNETRRMNDNIPERLLNQLGGLRDVYNAAVSFSANGQYEIATKLLGMHLNENLDNQLSFIYPYRHSCTHQFIRLSLFGELEDWKYLNEQEQIERLNLANENFGELIDLMVFNEIVSRNRSTYLDNLLGIVYSTTAFRYQKRSDEYKTTVTKLTTNILQELIQDNSASNFLYFAPLLKRHMGNEESLVNLYQKADKTNAYPSSSELNMLHFTNRHKTVDDMKLNNEECKNWMNKSNVPKRIRNVFPVALIENNFDILNSCQEDVKVEMFQELNKSFDQFSKLSGEFSTFSYRQFYEFITDQLATTFRRLEQFSEEEKKEFLQKFLPFYIEQTKSIQNNLINFSNSLSKESENISRFESGLLKTNLRDCFNLLTIHHRSFVNLVTRLSEENERDTLKNLLDGIFKENPLMIALNSYEENVKGQLMEENLRKLFDQEYIDELKKSTDFYVYQNTKELIMTEMNDDRRKLLKELHRAPVTTPMKELEDGLEEMKLASLPRINLQLRLFRQYMQSSQFVKAMELYDELKSMKVHQSDNIDENYLNIVEKAVPVYLLKLITLPDIVLNSNMVSFPKELTNENDRKELMNKLRNRITDPKSQLLQHWQLRDILNYYTTSFNLTSTMVEEQEEEIGSLMKDLKSFEKRHKEAIANSEQHMFDDRQLYQKNRDQSTIQNCYVSLVKNFINYVYEMEKSSSKPLELSTIVKRVDELVDELFKLNLFQSNNMKFLWNTILRSFIDLNKTKEFQSEEFNETLMKFFKDSMAQNRQMITESLLKHLVKYEDLDHIQEIYDIVREHYGPNNAISDLAFAFLSNHQIEQATRLLNLPTFQPRYDRFLYQCQLLAENEQTEELIVAYDFLAKRNFQFREEHYRYRLLSSRNDEKMLKEIEMEMKENNIHLSQISQQFLMNRSPLLKEMINSDEKNIPQLPNNYQKMIQLLNEKQFYVAMRIWSRMSFQDMSDELLLSPTKDIVSYLLRGLKTIKDENELQRIRQRLNTITTRLVSANRMEIIRHLSEIEQNDTSFNGFKNALIRNDLRKEDIDEFLEKILNGTIEDPELYLRNNLFTIFNRIRKSPNFENYRNKLEQCVAFSVDGTKRDFLLDELLTQYLQNNNLEEAKNLIENGIGLSETKAPMKRLNILQDLKEDEKLEKFERLTFLLEMMEKNLENKNNSKLRIILLQRNLYNNIRMKDVEKVKESLQQLNQCLGAPNLTDRMKGDCRTLLIAKDYDELVMKK